MPAPADGRRFTPRLLPTLLVAALVALMTWAGVWQLGRAASRRAQAEAFTAQNVVPVALPDGAAAPRYLHVRVEGHYQHEHQVLLDNMTEKGQVGYRVLTPFVTSAGVTVLVDRGWVALGASRQALPDVAVDESARVVTGRLDVLPRAGLDKPSAGAAGWPRVLNYPDWAALRALFGAALYPRLVLLDRELPDGYARNWKPEGPAANRNVGYAVQWFALALTLIVLYIVASFRRSAPSP